MSVSHGIFIFLISFYQDIMAIRQKEPEIVIKRGPRTVAISDLTSKELEKIIHDMEQSNLRIYAHSQKFNFSKNLNFSGDA